MDLVKKIEKKAWPENFKKIWTGERTFDLRLADFDCKPYDMLVLREYDPEQQKYSGRKVEKRVTSVLHIKSMADLEKWWKKEDIAKHGIYILAFK